MPAPAAIAKVALLFEANNAYARGLLVGIGDYILSHGPWSIHYAELGPADAPPPWLRTWDGHRIIVRGKNAASPKARPTTPRCASPSRASPTPSSRRSTARLTAACVRPQALRPPLRPTNSCPCPRNPRIAGVCRLPFRPSRFQVRVKSARGIDHATDRQPRLAIPKIKSAI